MSIAVGLIEDANDPALPPTTAAGLDGAVVDEELHAAEKRQIETTPIRRFIFYSQMGG